MIASPPLLRVRYFENRTVRYLDRRTSEQPSPRTTSVEAAAPGPKPSCEFSEFLVAKDLVARNSLAPENHTSECESPAAARSILREPNCSLPGPSNIGAAIPENHTTECFRATSCPHSTKSVDTVAPGPKPSCEFSEFLVAKDLVAGN